MSTEFIFPDWLPREPTPPSPPADDHRVEGLVNRFIAAKQATLFEAPDAFYRLEGGDAVEGEPAIRQRLQDLRTAALELARDQGERDALGPRLDTSHCVLQYFRGHAAKYSTLASLLQRHLVLASIVRGTNRRPGDLPL